jgi:hypothetical protein
VVLAAVVGERVKTSQEIQEQQLLELLIQAQVVVAVGEVILQMNTAKQAVQGLLLFVIQMPFH